MQPSPLEYAEIPSCAVRYSAVPAAAQSAGATAGDSVTVPVDTSNEGTATRKARKSSFSIPGAILSAGLHLDPSTPSNPRKTTLLSSKNALSLPTTTVNFRRFAAKSGPVFWLQDRIEEVVMWRRGWKHTCSWMAAYAFLCYFPKLVLLLPQVLLMTIILSSRAKGTFPNPLPIAPQPSEGSSEWYANLQAIQNLMGVVSDAVDFTTANVVPHLTFRTRYTPTILMLCVASMCFSLPIILFVPLRFMFLILGLVPFILTHPHSLHYSASLFRTFNKSVLTRLERFVDDDKLEVRHFDTLIRDVELWENERWVQGQGWNKTNLRSGERKPWTRARDGWSGDNFDGVGDMSTLSFTLDPCWRFVETEDWRKDADAEWIQALPDSDGWVYTNDAWLDPCNSPPDGVTSKSCTRRRRWRRRTYYVQG